MGDHIQARRQAEQAAELEKIRADAAAKRGNGRRRLPNVPDALTRGPLPGADGARRKQSLHNSYADHIQARRQAERAAELEKIRAEPPPKEVMVAAACPTSQMP